MFVFFLMYACRSSWSTLNTLTYVQILSYKNGVTIFETHNNTQHIQFASIMPVRYFEYMKNYRNGSYGSDTDTISICTRIRIRTVRCGYESDTDSKTCYPRTSVHNTTNVCM